MLDSFYKLIPQRFSRLAVRVLCLCISWLIPAMLGFAQSPFELANPFEDAGFATLQPSLQDPADQTEADGSEEPDPARAAGEEGIEELSKTPILVLDQRVTTVTRVPSTVGRSAAAVFVITLEMIRRSGATSIPEVLRMAPGVQVAKVDANRWAISIRGQNSLFSDKLQVQIDGRSVYTPLFGGVFWDVQDVILQDVERIEVIRGPGASVWGANAVNGIINVITKSAQETQGTLLSGGGGTEERGFSSVRHGGKIGDDLHYRVYGKQFERHTGFDPSGPPADDWRMQRTGARFD